jgi:hypothetical protein
MIDDVATSSILPSPHKLECSTFPMTQSSSFPLVSMSPPPPFSVGNIIDYITIGSAICGAIGSATALSVDFMRRRVRAKASEYAASNDFKLLREDLLDSRETFNRFLIEYRSDHSQIQTNHLDMVQRVTRLEVKFDD